MGRKILCGGSQKIYSKKEVNVGLGESGVNHPGSGTRRKGAILTRAHFAAICHCSSWVKYLDFHESLIKSKRALTKMQMHR